MPIHDHQSPLAARLIALVLCGVVLLLRLTTVGLADEASRGEHPITDVDREHWAFQPLKSPAIPAVQEQNWPHGPVDNFILAALEEVDLAPLPPATRTEFIRRVTLDLTGVPPTPTEVETFLADDGPDAAERLVDRLLASPRFGERWGQHWLDLARYADTDGFEHDLPRPTAWKYRDWVIQALNDDLPYDQFVQLQIAGDLLRPGDETAALATGFTVCGPDMPDINLVDERRHMVLNDIAATVGSVFLGLQVGCAQCHDHKMDPISQADFYRLRAFFEPGLQFDYANTGRVLRESVPSEPTAFYLRVRGDFRRLGPRVEPNFPRIAQENGDTTSKGEERPDRAALAEWLTRPDNPLTSRVIVNRLWQHHFGEGLVGTPSDFGVMGESPTHPELLDWLATEFARDGWSLKRSHRRLLTSAAYGQSSYARGSASNGLWEHGERVDPDNRLLWHARRQRLDGEAIRDSMLAASDSLSPRSGGPGVMPPLPEELVAALLKNQWVVSADEEDHRRRSIYLFVRRNLRYPLFEVFDRPDTNASCPRRARSTIAPQALSLLNSEFSLESSRRLALYVLEHAGSDATSPIELAYRRVLGRAPTKAESLRGVEFLNAQKKRIRRDGENRGDTSDVLAEGHDEVSEVKALTLYSLALFNLNEFVYVD